MAPQGLPHDAAALPVLGICYGAQLMAHELAAGFAAGPGPAFGADSPFHSAFALDTLALHHDAPPASS